MVYQETCTHRATEARAAQLSTNSMYQPDGTSPEFVGIVTRSAPCSRLNRNRYRALLDVGDVSDGAGCISRAFTIAAGSGVVNVAVPPRATDDGPPLRRGRGPSNRYGGL